MSHLASTRYALLAATLLAAAVAGVPVLGADRQEAEPADGRAKPETTPEDERAREREEAQKLRELREEQESQRREAARKREAEQARQGEIVRLRTMLMGLQQRESTLNHDVRTLQHQIDALPRSSADQSITARRGELERQLGYSQNQLDDARRSRESASKQLDSLRFRY